MKFIGLILSSWLFSMSVNAKTINVVIPFNVGGATDQIWRLIQPHLDQELKKYDLLLEPEYLPGAGGGLGAAAVLRRDRPTLLFTSSSLALVPVVNNNLQYDISEFSIIGYVGHLPLVLFVSGSGPSDVNQLQSLCKKRPITYGNSGYGSMTSVAGDFIIRNLGCRPIPVPYKSANQSLFDLIGDGIDITVDHPTANTMVFSQEMKIRPLVVMCQKRIAVFPTVPCTSEIGLDSPFTNWQVLVANKNLPQSDLDIISQALKKVLNTDRVKSALTQIGLDGINLSIQKQWLISEQKKFRKLLVP